MNEIHNSSSTSANNLDLISQWTQWSRYASKHISLMILSRLSKLSKYICMTSYPLSHFTAKSRRKKPKIRVILNHRKTSSQIARWKELTKIDYMKRWNLNKVISWRNKTHSVMRTMMGSSTCLALKHRRITSNIPTNSSSDKTSLTIWNRNKFAYNQTNPVNPQCQLRRPLIFRI